MKISKTTMADIEALRVVVAATQETVEVAFTVYNEALAELKSKLESEHDDLQSEFEEKSERWQESDKGTAASEWIDAIGSLADALDEVSVPDFPDLSDVEQLADAPDEM